MKIGHLDTDQRVVIVAEIGNNHEGDLAAATAMIRAAAEAGADVVKFQTIAPERLVSADQVDRVAQLKRFQLQRQQFEALAHIARDAGVMFMSTPFDLECVTWLDAIVPAFKIASGDNDFFPLLDRVAATGKPVLVSLGFGGHAQAASLVQFFTRTWAAHGVSAPGLGLLHCVAAYPTPDEQANLGAIPSLRGLGATVGYSDHTLGIKAAELAVAAGARIIEKHFTIDKGRASFRDHQLSADPDDLRRLVVAIRHAEQLMAIPVGAAPDMGPPLARRSIAAARAMAPGTIVAAGDLTWLRPGTGFRPGQEHELVGRTLRTAVAAGHLFHTSDFE